MYFNEYVLNRKIGVLLKSESIARRTGLRRMGCTQKVQMFKRITRNPYRKCIRKWNCVEQSAKITTSKSVCDRKSEKRLIVLKYEHA